ncbi:hypothetical protein E4T43_06961 [Aureobasidium subglaciale]|nr:hypothetical protein E4T43_06961 [Aureobasidium subglaciale]
MHVNSSPDKMTTSGIPTDSTSATSNPHPEKHISYRDNLTDVSLSISSAILVSDEQSQTPPSIKIPSVTYILPNSPDPNPTSAFGPQIRVLRITLKDDARFDTITAWNIVWCNIRIKQQVGFFHSAGELLWHENGKKWLHPAHTPEINCERCGVLIWGKAGLATGDAVRVMRVSKPREDANVIVVAGDT